MTWSLYGIVNLEGRGPSVLLELVCPTRDREGSWVLPKEGVFYTSNVCFLMFTVEDTRGLSVLCGGELSRALTPSERSSCGCKLTQGGEMFPSSLLMTLSESFLEGDCNIIRGRLKKRRKICVLYSVKGI